MSMAGRPVKTSNNMSSLEYLVDSLRKSLADMVFAMGHHQGFARLWLVKLLDTK